MRKTAWLMLMLVVMVGVLAVAGCRSRERRASSTGAVHAQQTGGRVAGQEIVGPDGGQLVWVPAGSFTRGRATEEMRWLVANGLSLLSDPTDEQPARELQMEGFWMGKLEVTNAQYRKFCAATGRPFPEKSDQGDNHPVVWVNWEEAQAYCQHYGLSLLTEAQWEYAARGPKGRIFPWGNEWGPGESRLCWIEKRGPGGRTSPVGSFPRGASWCGALDMAGNVLEWCADWYQQDYYAQAPASNPPGPTQGTSRVLRGGSYLDVDGDCRCGDRLNCSPTDRNNFSGFRCVRTE